MAPTPEHPEYRLPLEPESVFQERANAAADAMRNAARSLNENTGLAIVALWKPANDPVVAYRALGEFNSELILGMSGFGGGRGLNGADGEKIFVYYNGGGKKRGQILEAGLRMLGIESAPK
ncbi:MAG: hypothetical protein Q7S79_02370 [bacterium]|nr:hypothetical protein [bacterium]